MASKKKTTTKKTGRIKEADLKKVVGGAGARPGRGIDGSKKTSYDTGRIIFVPGGEQPSFTVKKIGGHHTRPRR